MEQREEHHEIPRRLRDDHALLLHGQRQARRRELHLVLHLHLRGVGIGARVKIKIDGRDAGRVGAGRHVQQVVDAVHLLLDHGDDRVLQRLGRGAGVIRRDRNRRRRDARILGDGQLRDRQRAEAA